MRASQINVEQNYCKSTFLECCLLFGQFYTNNWMNICYLESSDTYPKTSFCIQKHLHLLSSPFICSFRINFSKGIVWKARERERLFSRWKSCRLGAMQLKCSLLLLLLNIYRVSHNTYTFNLFVKFLDKFS